ncbi:MAG: hypothetical protein ACSHXZ_15120 [Gammaproteobacteria bacterium]
MKQALKWIAVVVLGSLLGQVGIDLYKEIKLSIASGNALETYHSFKSAIVKPDIQFAVFSVVLVVGLVIFVLKLWGWKKPEPFWLLIPGVVLAEGVARYLTEGIQSFLVGPGSEWVTSHDTTSWPRGLFRMAVGIGLCIWFVRYLIEKSQHEAP